MSQKVQLDLFKEPKPKTRFLKLWLPVGVLAAIVAIGMWVLTSTQPAFGEARIEEVSVTCEARDGLLRQMDGGKAVSISTVGKDDDDIFSDLVALDCILTEFGVPETTQQKIMRTRALDGTVTDTWDGHSASWTYHPDSGMNLLIQEAN